MGMTDNLMFPVTGYRFQVLIDQILTSFAKVTNLRRENSYETYQEGGTNDRVLLFRKPKEEADVLRLERGIWNVELMSFSPGMRLKNITIMVMRNMIPVKTYSIEEAIVRSVSVSDLDAMDGKVMIETLELLHTGMEPVRMK